MNSQHNREKLMVRPRTIAAALVTATLALGSAALAPALAAGRFGPKASTGCGRTTAPTGERRITTTSRGTARAYFRHVPPGYDGRTPLPLVLDLHGTTEPAAVHKSNSMLGPFGDKHHFVTITPEGSGPPAQWDTRFDSADMQFLGDLLDEAERTLCIDARRVFVAGYSNGAFMASAIACVYANRIAAVAPVAGIRDVPGCTPERRVPVVAFHGTADEFVSFGGGLGTGVSSLPPADAQELVAIAAPSDSGKSIPEVAAAWAARNGCAPKPKQSPVAHDVKVVRYSCPARADVELYEINGGGHTWPGSKFSKAIEQFVGPTTLSIDADAVMWKFFQQHPLRGSPTRS
jgi:polyhydroxybutyrate depolymerase